MESEGPISWLPEKLLNNNQKKFEKNILNEYQFIGFYFSSNWTDNCKNATKKLIDFYVKMNNIDPESKIFEVVYFASDDDEKTVQNYCKSMPWLICPFNCIEQESIENGCEINHIPALIIFSSSGELIEEKGETVLENDAETTYATWLSKIYN